MERFAKAIVLALLLGFLDRIAHAQVAFDKATRANGASTAPSVSQTPNSPPTVVFCDLCYGSAVATITADCTYGGNAMTITQAMIRNVNATLAQYGLANPPTGNQTCACTLNTSSSWSLAISTYTGSDTTTAFGTAVTDNTQTTAPSVTVTSATNHLVHEATCLVTGGSPTLTTPSGGTDNYNASFGGILRSAASRTAGAASVTVARTAGGTAPVDVITGIDILTPAASSPVQRRPIYMKNDVDPLRWFLQNGAHV